MKNKKNKKHIHIPTQGNDCKKCKKLFDIYYFAKG